MVVGREQDASSPTHCWEDVLGEVCEECSIIVELGISWNQERQHSFPVDGPVSLLVGLLSTGRLEEAWVISLPEGQGLFLVHNNHVRIWHLTGVSCVRH